MAWIYAIHQSLHIIHSIMRLHANFSTFDLANLALYRAREQCIQRNFAKWASLYIEKFCLSTVCEISYFPEILNIYFCAQPTHPLKGTVSRKITGVKSGINQ